MLTNAVQSHVDEFHCLVAEPRGSAKQLAQRNGARLSNNHRKRRPLNQCRRHRCFVRSTSVLSICEKGATRFTRLLRISSLPAFDYENNVADFLVTSSSNDPTDQASY